MIMIYLKYSFFLYLCIGSNYRVKSTACVSEFLRDIIPRWTFQVTAAWFSSTFLVYNHSVKLLNNAACLLNKHQTLAQGWPTAGPASKTLSQLWASVGPRSRARCVADWFNSIKRAVDTLGWHVRSVGGTTGHWGVLHHPRNRPDTTHVPLPPPPCRGQRPALVTTP